MLKESEVTNNEKDKVQSLLSNSLPSPRQWSKTRKTYPEKAANVEEKIGQARTKLNKIKEALTSKQKELGDE